MPPYYDFSANYNNIAIIFAYGQTSMLSQHQQESTMMLTLEQHGHSASTSTTKAPNGIVYYSASSILFSDVNQQISLTIFPDSDTVQIVYTGPMYAIGFGNDAMNNTYAIIIDGFGEVSERLLGYHNPGELLQAKVKVLSDMYFDEETRQ
ncbi:hypothetical protein RFI_39605, partial [Reticulomyxa filosa]